MADDAAAKKKATDDAEAAAAAAALAWPTGGYDLFISRLLVLMLAVYVLLIEGSILCSIRASILRYRYEMHTFYAMLTVYSWISLIRKMLIFPTLSTNENSSQRREPERLSCGQRRACRRKCRVEHP